MKAKARKGKGMKTTKKRAAEIERDKARAKLKAILCEASRPKRTRGDDPPGWLERTVMVYWVCRYNGAPKTCVHRYSFHVVNGDGEIRDVTGLVAHAMGEKAKDYNGHWCIAVGGGGYHKPTHCIETALGATCIDWLRMEGI